MNDLFIVFVRLALYHLAKFAIFGFKKIFRDRSFVYV